MLEKILSLHYGKTVVNIEREWEGGCYVHFDDGQSDFSDYSNLLNIVIQYIENKERW